MKNKNLKKSVLNSFIAFFSIVALFCFILIFYNKFKVNKENEILSEFVVYSNNGKISNSSEEKEEVIEYNDSSLIESYRKKYNNNDIVGILSIPDTKVNTLLLQTDSNEYYVRRLPNKKKHVTGSVFIDYRTKLDENKNVIIYGHNANNYDIPFKYLRNYLNKNYYLDHKYIEIETEYNKQKYEIFSVYTTNNDYFHLETNFLNDESWINHLKKLESKSIYGTNISLSASDSIITLQTCLLKDNALIIISAKKV